MVGIVLCPLIGLIGRLTKVRARQSLASYLSLLILLAAEFGLAKLPLVGARGSVLVPASIMAAVVAMRFMQPAKGPPTAGILPSPSQSGSRFCSDWALSTR